VVACNDKATLVLLEGIVPKGQISQHERTEQVAWALQMIGGTKADLDRIKNERAKEAEAAYDRLREQIGGSQIAVTPHDPDILGVYVLLPGAGQ
jgi:hypothetical protein